MMTFDGFWQAGWTDLAAHLSEPLGPIIRRLMVAVLRLGLDLQGWEERYGHA